MKVCELNTINLLGPGSSISSLIYSDQEKYFAFSNNSLTFLLKNDIVPDFFYFFDPNSIYLLFTHLKQNPDYIKKLSKKCCLLYHDFHESSKFYELGFTTTKGKNWFVNCFCKDIFPEFKSFFKKLFCLNTEIIKPPPQSRNIYVCESFFNNLNSISPFLIIPKCKVNIDKFSCCVIPTLISHFPNLKLVKSLGFGDFNLPRIGHPIGADIRHYAEYTKSFNHVFPALYKFLDQNSIKIDFLNKDSYYNKQ